jgi:hypothetical protein
MSGCRRLAAAALLALLHGYSMRKQALGVPLALMIGLISGCSESPIAPQPVAEAAVAAKAADISAEDLSDFAAAVEDLVDRVLPGMGSTADIAQLSADLQQLVTKMAAGETKDASHLLDHIAKQMDGRGSDLFDEAEFGFVQLVLDRAEELLATN